MRRFYQSATTPPETHDTIASFGSVDIRRLRQHIDPDTLSAQLLAVVEETMQPTSVSLWLRPSATWWMVRHGRPS